MKLTSTNRYLRDPNMRETMVTRSVATSSAIEGIRTPFGHHPRTAKSRKSVATAARQESCQASSSTDPSYTMAS
jgi:hypothetical protein